MNIKIPHFHTPRLNEDLKKYSKLYFRVNCDGITENQFELSLKGSTKALDQIGIEKGFKANQCFTRVCFGLNPIPKPILIFF